jgi:hypothetical protein
MARRTKWANVPAEERRTIVNNVFAMRPQFTQIWAEFDELRADFREGAAATCMMIIGDTGVGKSTLVKEYANANLPLRLETEDGFSTQTPVLLVSLKGQSQSLGAAQTILKKLMRAQNASGRLSNVTDRIETQMQRQAVELLILDEFQHLAEAGAEKTRSQTADWIKGLAKETRVPIVLVGMPSLAEVIAANAQLASITPLRRALGEFNYSTVRGRKALADFLAELDALFPFDEKSGFNEPWFTEKLFQASGGNPRFLCRLLQWGAKAAIREGAKRVGTRHLEVAYDRFGGLGGIVDENPFAQTTLLKEAS